MLDVPNFFWDSEPTLHPLYDAVREYLEIKPRIQVLNERCRVFLDLAEILSDSIADNKMSRKYLCADINQTIADPSLSRSDMDHHHPHHPLHLSHLLRGFSSFRYSIHTWIKQKGLAYVYNAGSY